MDAGRIAQKKTGRGLWVPAALLSRQIDGEYDGSVQARRSRTQKEFMPSWCKY
jgi:hypothetical protein